MSAPLLTIAAGGTGGHMAPAQALAETMLERGWRVRLSTDTRGERYSGAFPDAVERRVVRAATFARGDIFAKLMAPFLIAWGCLSAILQMMRDRPSVVVGFGGYPAIPAMVAAYVLRVPRMIHEQNGVLGRVNHLFAGRVDKVACSVWPTDLPSSADGIHTGNPIRQNVAVLAGAPYNAPYNAPGQGALNLLVFGGSQGASILSNVVPEAIALLPAQLQARLSVVQQARPADETALKARYAELGVTADVRPYYQDIPERLAASQLVIARSGASSVADIAAIGRPSILVPLAIATDDHQTANAKPFEAAEAAVVIAEAQFTPETLSQELGDILTNPTRAAQMAAASKSTGRPDAVDRLASLVLELHKGPIA